MADTSPGRALLGLALTFGILTGFAEAMLFAVKRLLLGQFVRVGPDIAWMAPVADAVLFVALALALIGASRLWPRLASLPVAAFVFVFAAMLSLLLMYYPLHVIAKVALAAGVATQTARIASRRPDWFSLMRRRGLVAATVLTAAVIVTVRLGSWVAYTRHVEGLPSPPAGAPNVLLVVWDTVRAANLSLHGYERRTSPYLERWAASSVVFDQASATSPWTLPSHGSMFTGRWPRDLSADWERALDDTYPTLAEALAARGYVTAGFVANTFYAGYEHGLGRGFASYEDYVPSWRELVVSSALAGSVVNSYPVRRLAGFHDNIPRRSAAEVTDAFLSWQQRTGARPFFAFLNYFDAHESYLPPATFAAAFGGASPRGSPNLIQDRRRTLRRDWATRPADEIDAEIRLYDGAILYLDDQLNRLLLTLQSRGVLDNTVVIVTSDHGEQFGEHGLFLHGNSLYRPVLHVPLVIRFPPAAPGGTRVRSRVSLRDLPATVLDLLHARGSPDPFPGSSLARYWSESGGRAQETDVALAQVRQAQWALPDFAWYPAARGDMASATDGVYHYIRNGDGREELYSIAADPGERHNLADREEMRPLVERYRAYAAGADRRVRHE